MTEALIVEIEGDIHSPDDDLDIASSHLELVPDARERTAQLEEMAEFDARSLPRPRRSERRVGGRTLSLVKSSPDKERERDWAERAYKD